MAVSAKELMDELHIDYDDVEETTVSNLIDASKAIVADSVSNKLSVEDLEENHPKLFDLAVKSLACSLYYDRELKNGTSKGFQMMIVHLTTQIALAEKSDDNADKAI